MIQIAHFIPVYKNLIERVCLAEGAVENHTIFCQAGPELIENSRSFFE